MQNRFASRQSIFHPVLSLERQSVFVNRVERLTSQVCVSYKEQGTCYEMKLS